MRKCENCGANLDSGERCDCEMEGREKQNGAGKDAAGDDTVSRGRAYKRCRGGGRLHGAGARRIRPHRTGS